MIIINTWPPKNSPINSRQTSWRKRVLLIEVLGLSTWIGTAPCELSLLLLEIKIKTSLKTIPQPLIWIQSQIIVLNLRLQSSLSKEHFKSARGEVDCWRKNPQIRSEWRFKAWNRQLSRYLKMVPHSNSLIHRCLSLWKEKTLNDASKMKKIKVSARQRWSYHSLIQLFRRSLIEKIYLIQDSFRPPQTIKLIKMLKIAVCKTIRVSATTAWNLQTNSWTDRCIKLKIAWMKGKSNVHFQLDQFNIEGHL